MDARSYKKNKIEFLSLEYFQLFNNWDDDIDSHHWHMGDRVNHANPETYHMLNHAWGVDDALAFYCGNINKMITPANLVALNEAFATDGINIFGYNNIVKADVATFEVLDDSWFIETYPERKVVYGGYAKDRGHVYYASKYHTVTILKDVDVASFHSLGFSFGADKNNVYYADKLLEGLNPEQVRLLAPDMIADDKNAYYETTQMTGVELDSLKIIENDNHFNRWAKDKNKVFDLYDSYFVEDSSGFEFIDSHHKIGKDSIQLYINGKPFSNFDLNTFKNLGNGYYRDADHVYFENRLVEGADMASFTGYSPGDDGFGYGDGRDCNGQWRYGLPEKEYYKQQQALNDKSSNERRQATAQRYASSWKEKLKTTGIILSIPFMLVLAIPYGLALMLFSGVRKKDKSEINYDENRLLVARILSHGDLEIIKAMQVLQQNPDQYAKIYGDPRTSPGTLLHSRYDELQYERDNPEPGEIFFEVLEDLLNQRFLLISAADLETDDLLPWLQRFTSGNIDLGFIELMNKHQKQTGNWLDGEDLLKITDDVLKIAGYRLINLSDWEAEDVSSTSLVTQKEFDKLIKIETGGDYGLSEVYSTTSYYQEAKNYILTKKY